MLGITGPAGLAIDSTGSQPLGSVLTVSDGQALTVSGGPFIVGNSGSGSLSVAGGSVTVGSAVTNNGQLVIAANAGSTGLCSASYGQASAGAITVNGSAYIGGNASTAGGVGVLNVSSQPGVVVTGALNIYNTSGTSVNLSNSGELTVGSLNTNGNPSLVNLGSGILKINSALTVDSGQPLGSNINAPNGQLRCNSLVNNGNITLNGVFASGSFTNNGRINSEYIDPTTFTNNGAVSAETFGGGSSLSFYQNGGTLSGTSANNGSLFIGGGLTLVSFYDNGGTISAPTVNLSGDTDVALPSVVNTLTFGSGAASGHFNLIDGNWTLASDIPVGISVTQTPNNGVTYSINAAGPSFTNNGTLVGAFSNLIAQTLNNSVGATLTANYISATVINNSGTLSFQTVSGNLNNSGTIIAGPGPVVSVTGSLINAMGGTVTLLGPFNISGGFANSGTLTVGTNANLVVSTLTNNGTSVISSNLTAGSLINNVGATLTANNVSANVINNCGTFSVSSLGINFTFNQNAGTLNSSPPGGSIQGGYDSLGYITFNDNGGTIGASTVDLLCGTGTLTFGPAAAAGNFVLGIGAWTVGNITAGSTVSTQSAGITSVGNTLLNNGVLNIQSYPPNNGYQFKTDAIMGNLINAGTVNFEPGLGYYFNQVFVVIFTDSLIGNLVNNVGGTVNITVPLNVSGGIMNSGTISVSGGGNLSTGVVTLLGGTATFPAFAVGNTNANATFVNLSGGAMTVTGGLSINSGAEFNLAGGTLSVMSLNLFGVPAGLRWTAGTLNLSGGTAIVGQLNVPNAGTLTGQGIIAGNVSNQGVVVPLSNSGATLLIQGNYNQSTSAMLSLTLAGAVQGSGYDYLEGTGAANVSGGTLDLNISGFNPTVGETFQILNFSSGVIGQFAYIVVQPGGYSFSQLSSTGVITLNSIGTTTINSTYNTATGTGVWNVNGNWNNSDGSIAYPNNGGGSVYNATINGSNASGTQVSLPVAVTINNLNLTNASLNITNTGGLTINGTATLNAAALNNNGTLTLAGGTLNASNASTVTSTGSIVGHGTIIASSNTSVMIEGPLTQSGGGDLMFNGGTTFYLYSVTTLAAGYSLQLAGTGSLQNYGVLNLSGGTISSGSNGAQFYNTSIQNAVGPTGIVNGPGTISVALENYYSNSVVNSGSGIAFSAVSNNGIMLLSGTNSFAGAFYNYGSVTLGGSQNWSTGITFTNGTGGTATFNSDAGSAAASPLNVVVNGGLVNFNSSQHLASLTVASGATAQLNGGAIGSRSILVTPSLTVTGRLDLTSSYVDLQGSNSLASITALVKSGYNNGGWNGASGILSSTAAGDSTHLTALGVIQNNQSGSALYTAAKPFDGATPGAGDTLIKFTYYGDTNLDGKVDGSDYIRIDNGLSQKLTGWYNGDFNYDGIIDGSDYALIDNSFNTQGANLAAEIASPTAQTGGSSAVPEPASMSLMAAGAIGLLLRRRRSSPAKGSRVFACLIIV